MMVGKVRLGLPGAVPLAAVGRLGSTKVTVRTPTAYEWVAELLRLVDRTAADVDRALPAAPAVATAGTSVAAATSNATIIRAGRRVGLVLIGITAPIRGVRTLRTPSSSMAGDVVYVDRLA